MSSIDASAAREPDPGENLCADCGELVAPGARFCAACGGVQRAAPRVAATREEPESDQKGDAAGRCRGCGAELGDPADGEPDAASRFCRECGQLQQQRDGLHTSAAAKAAREGRARGHCLGCGEALPERAHFCRSCGAATRLLKQRDDDQIMQDPGWYKVARGLGLIFTGTLSQVLTMVGLLVMSTVMLLFSSSLGSGALTLFVAMFGVAVVAVLVGLVLALIGEVYCLSAPAGLGVRLLAGVILGLDAILVVWITLLVVIVKSGSGARFVSTMATWPGMIFEIIFVIRLGLVALQLRRVAFALKYFSIAQGAIGFMIFAAVGWGITTLLLLLFASARPAAASIAQLVGLAYFLLVYFWFLTMLRRGRDQVRQRLA